MDRKVIKESRVKTTALFLICLGGMLAALKLHRGVDDPVMNLVTAAFFGAICIALAVRLIRPLTLLLDQSGFTLIDTFGKVRTMSWTLTSPFYLESSGKGGSVIAYNHFLGPGASRLASVTNDERGGHAVLPGAWPGTQAEAAERFNAYRAKALEAARSPA